MNRRPVIGWDLGRGGGREADSLPCDPVEVLLFPANPNYSAGEAAEVATVDVFGFDPRVNLACGFYRPKSPSALLDLPKTNVTATIEARALWRSPRGGLIVGPVLDPAALFSNGGNLDSEEEGCEINSGAQGIRFTITATRTAATSVDVVAVLQARPTVTLVCPDLAYAIREGLKVLANPSAFASSGE